MSRRIRLMLVLTVVGVAGALLLAPAQAQFQPGGVGGRPGGGIGGQPPAGIGGQPGNIGGIAGQPGIGGQPGNIGGINGQPGNIAGQPGFQGNAPHVPKVGPIIEYEWVCSGCGAVVSTGPFKPNLTSCPKCGVKFRNGLDHGIDFNQGAAFNPPPAAAPPPQNAPNNAANQAAFEAGRTAGRLLVFGVIGFGGLLVVVAVVIVVIVAIARSGQTTPAPRRSRSRAYHDD